MNKLLHNLQKDTRLRIPYTRPAPDAQTDPPLSWAEFLPEPPPPSRWRYAATAAGTVVLAGGIVVLCLSPLQNAGDPSAGSDTTGTFLVTTTESASTSDETTSVSDQATTPTATNVETTLPNTSVTTLESTQTFPTTITTSAGSSWNPSEYLNTADVINHNGICQKDGWIYRVEDSETNICTDTVIKIRPDGSEKQTVFTLSDASVIRDLQIIGQWLYYKANHRSDGRVMTGIYRTRFDGTDTQCLLYHGQSSNDMFIDGLYIYDLIYPYTDEWKNQPSENVVLYRYRLDGTKKEEVCNFTQLGYELDRPNIRLHDGYLYFTDYRSPEGIYTINRINLSDQTVSVIREWGRGKFHQKNIYFHVDSGWLYFYEHDIGIKRIRLDGSDETVVFPYPSNGKNVWLDISVRGNILYVKEDYSDDIYYVPLEHPEQYRQITAPYTFRSLSILDGRVYFSGSIAKFRYENGKKVAEEFTGVFFSTNYEMEDVKELYRKKHPPEYFFG